MVVEEHGATMEEVMDVRGTTNVINEAVIQMEVVVGHQMDHGMVGDPSSLEVVDQMDQTDVDVDASHVLIHAFSGNE